MSGRSGNAAQIARNATVNRKDATMTRRELRGFLWDAFALMSNQRSRLLDQIRGIVDDDTLVKVAETYSRWDTVMNEISAATVDLPDDAELRIVVVPKTE
jgi:hypothetical protein